MKEILFILKTTFLDLLRNKGRTILTSLGILIGVLSVILLMAVGLGLKKYIEDQFEGLGANLLYVMPGQVLGEGGGFQDPGSSLTRFEEDDVARLKKTPNIVSVVPVFEKASFAEFAGEKKSTQILATTNEIVGILQLEIEFGSMITEGDVDKRAKKIVIGPKLAEDLFQSKENAIGRKLQLSDQVFQVVGVVKSKGGGSFGGPSFDSISYIPYKSGSINPDKVFSTIYVQVDDKENIEKVKADLTRELLRRYDEDEFQIIEQTELINTISSIFGIVNIVLVAIAAISLVVGGIGIMNIMYVTVTERIKEIGIRRAVGARKSDILYLFIIESVTLSLFGGLTALGLAFIIIFFVQKSFPAYIDLMTVLIALGVSSAIGIMFGVFPAKKAADLSPIDAIRYE